MSLSPTIPADHIDYVKLTNEVSIPMVKILGGSFIIGDYDNIHKGELDTFWLGQFPVTNAQYRLFVEDSGNHQPYWFGEDGPVFDFSFKDQGGALKAYNHPVVGVNWDDATAFCVWISKITGQDFCLPSEAQWEYAALGGQQNQDSDYAGSHRLEEVGWFRKNSHGTTQPVGLKLPNELGLYDMCGNVWEWCADHWYGQYKRKGVDSSDVEYEEEGEARVMRGAAFGNNAGACRVSHRDWAYPWDAAGPIGFRIARK